MIFSFQKTIAYSQTTLPASGILALVLWFVLPAVPDLMPSLTSDYGLWGLVPSDWLDGKGALVLNAGCAAAAVYLMAELNNAFVLLRVSSRMLSSILAILLAVAVACHGSHEPGCLLMVFVLLAFFPLFASYQQPSPRLTFFVHLTVAVASLVFPKLLWTVPVLWVIQLYFRAFTLRCLVASLLGIILPYWLCAGVATLTGSLPVLMPLLTAARWETPDYAQLDLRHVLTFAWAILLFLVGTADFYMHQFLDKTRIRITYNAIIIYGMATIALIAAQPQHFTALLPVLLTCTAIVFGHFFTLTHTRFSHICCLVLLVITLAVGIVQFLCDSQLRLRDF